MASQKFQNFGKSFTPALKRVAEMSVGFLGAGYLQNTLAPRLLYPEGPPANAKPVTSVAVALLAVAAAAYTKNNDMRAVFEGAAVAGMTDAFGGFVLKDKQADYGLSGTVLDEISGAEFRPDQYYPASQNGVGAWDDRTFGSRAQLVEAEYTI